jgi:L-lactate dehydrogenase complex protein LldF
MLSTQQFKKDTFSALNNPQLRGNFKRAMSGLMQKRLAVFPDDQEFQQLREIGHYARENALHKLPELLKFLIIRKYCKTLLHQSGHGAFEVTAQLRII